MKRMILAILALFTFGSAFAGTYNGYPVTQYHRYPSRDSDRDGFDDCWELKVLTNPRSAASRPTLAENRYKLVAYWPLSSDANEALAGELNGTPVCGAAFRYGALSLDGRKAHVNFGASPSLSLADGFTYCIWVQPQGYGVFDRVLGKVATSPSGEEAEYGLFLGWGGVWSMLSLDGSTDDDKLCWDWALLPHVPFGNWLHLGVSRVPDATSDTTRIHVNGHRAWSLGWGVDPLACIFSGSADLTLGSFDISGTHVSDAFKGRATQLILCCEPLSDLEMRELYALGADGDLLAYLDADNDRDGLPDAWERQCFGDVTHDGSGDSDGDGFTDAEEFAAGTDPTDPTSFPAPQTVALDVRSAHGHCMPPVGVQTYPMGATAACRNTLSPVTEGASQYVCTGWVGAGSVPPAGSNLEFAVTSRRIPR